MYVELSKYYQNNLKQFFYLLDGDSKTHCRCCTQFQIAYLKSRRLLVFAIAKSKSSNTLLENQAVTFLFFFWREKVTAHMKSRQLLLFLFTRQCQNEDKVSFPEINERVGWGS